MATLIWPSSSSKNRPREASCGQVPIREWCRQSLHDMWHLISVQKEKSWLMYVGCLCHDTVLSSRAAPRFPLSSSYSSNFSPSRQFMRLCGILPATIDQARQPTRYQSASVREDLEGSSFYALPMAFPLKKMPVVINRLIESSRHVFFFSIPFEFACQSRTAILTTSEFGCS